MSQIQIQLFGAKAFLFAFGCEGNRRVEGVAAYRIVPSPKIAKLYTVQIQPLALQVAPHAERTAQPLAFHDSFCRNFL